MPAPDFHLMLSDYVMDMQLPKDIPKYREDFKNASYSKWAVNELQMYIIRKQDRSPIASTKEFIRMIDDFAKRSNKNDKPIFSIAKSVATDILDIFNAMQ